MVIYIDRAAVPDTENITNEVFKYLLEKAEEEISCLDGLYKAYRGKNIVQSSNKDEVKVNINYGKYVVDIVRSFFLGEPVKYDNNDSTDEKPLFSASGAIQASVKNGKVIKHEWDKIGKKEIDISPIISAYDDQIISKVDSKIGKYMGIFGSAQELLYASDEKIPKPKSAVIMPQNCILVQDNTIEHRDIFFMVFEKRERLNRQEYYAVTVYTDKTERYYESTDLQTFMFTPKESRPHFYGAVPCVNYDNDDDRQGDLEQIITLSEAYSQLMSDRLTDKRKFIDAILAIYGFELPDENSKNLRENKLIDGIPIDGRIEYIQRVFDESSVKILGDDLVRDIHKTSMTVDMSDESFSGNVTGVALELKFMPMSFLTKTKIRNMDEGLKKRFELYNNWLVTKGVMQPVSKNDIDVVFTIDMPANISETVSVVKDLEGRVDEKTLLALLPFVKDPAEMAKIMKEQKEEKQKQFMDSFGSKNPTESGEESKQDNEE